MKDYLEELFDYQEFEHNKKIDYMLMQTDERLGCYELSDDQLDLVAGGMSVAIIEEDCSGAMKRGMGHSDSESN